LIESARILGSVDVSISDSMLNRLEFQLYGEHYTLLNDWNHLKILWRRSGSQSYIPNPD